MPSRDPQEVDAHTVIVLEQLCARYWNCADQSSAGVGELFTEDGVLILGSLEVAGRNAIESFFREREDSMRAEGRTTRHAACTLLATGMGDGCVRLRSTVLVFSGSGALPLPASTPSGIADFSDVCVRSATGRWQFARREGRTIFVGAGAPAFAR